MTAARELRLARRSLRAAVTHFEQAMHLNSMSHATRNTLNVYAQSTLALVESVCWRIADCNAYDESRRREARKVVAKARRAA